jgi:hypothetical protein
MYPLIGNSDQVLVTAFNFFLYELPGTCHYCDRRVCTPLDTFHLVRRRPIT